MGKNRASTSNAYCEYICNILLIICSFAIHSFSRRLCAARYLLCVMPFVHLCLRAFEQREREQKVAHTVAKHYLIAFGVNFTVAFYKKIIRFVEYIDIGIKEEMCTLHVCVCCICIYAHKRL